MIRFHFKRLIAEKEFREGRRIRLEEVAEATGVHRTTLSKIVNRKGCNTTTDVVDKLCRYFGCPLDQLIEYTDDEVVGSK